MTWSNMSHEVKKFKGLLTNDKDEVIGFILSGMTYDGDGNEQWEQGTDMEIIFDDADKMKFIMKAILDSIGRERGDYDNTKVCCRDNK